ncbi:pseudouridine synthase [Phenylobacterium sp. J367]|uniref:pseudouridine synthase n=1 Tax=Phenylobacterium sp. J367 TaxID=2898435 RepID=UPI002151133C|nr:pseudouridine synthase [Phenylobacterium sp. J367]MCR5877858.1 rRNA pseudouridine synthase [Phenylobacterium sp. J367]
MVHDPHRTGGKPPGQARTSEKPREGAPQAGGDRIAKALARAGVGSRRDVERYIAEGRVALNGQVLTSPAVKVEPGDILTVDGQVVEGAEPTRLFRYHKPVGLLTSHKDPAGRPTVFGALPDGLPRLISVGRLDINSEGLLLLTNDGELARAMELPQAGVVRRYRARAHGRITQDRLDKLKDGITVEGVRYGAIDAKLDKAKEGPQGSNLWITVTLSEGKNREVRRVLEALGLKVNRLIRLAYGPFALGTLAVGEIEEVGPRVIREQLADHIPPENMPKGDRPQFQKTATATPPRRRQAAAPEGATLIDRGPRRADEARPRGRPGARPQGTKAGQKPGAKPAWKAERPAGPGRPGPARPAAAAGDGPKKKVFKAGWAKPKPKASHAPKKPGGGPKKRG